MGIPRLPLPVTLAFSSLQDTVESLHEKRPALPGMLTEHLQKGIKINNPIT